MSGWRGEVKNLVPTGTRAPTPRPRDRSQSLYQLIYESWLYNHHACSSKNTIACDQKRESWRYNNYIWNEGNSAKRYVRTDSPKNNHRVSSKEMPDFGFGVIITCAVERMQLTAPRRQNHCDMSVTSEVGEMSLTVHDRVMTVWLLHLPNSREGTQLYLLDIALCCCLHDASFFLGLLLNSENVDNSFLRNVSRLSADYMTLYPRTLYSHRCENLKLSREAVHIEKYQTVGQEEL
jgi:hypothetical protein